MRIGFDISQTGNGKAGCGYFADSIIQQLARIDLENEYILYPTFGNVFWDPEWESSTRRVDLPKFRRAEGHTTIDKARAFWSNPPEDLETSLGKPDIIHSNNFFCPRGLKSARLVYTLYDLSFLDHPEWHTEENRLGCFEGVFNACLYADMIVSISEYSRRHFLEMFPHFSPDRIVVVRLASRFSLKPDLGRPASLICLKPGEFWLTVGTLEPRKNQLRLLRAYARLKSSLLKTFPLVMAGGRGWLMEDIHKTAADLGLAEAVIMPGYLDDAALQWLYQNCYAMVYPSLFEGVGLPVLEAMSLGAPVISSNVTSIPEIAGNAGILVDPLAEEEILRAMLRLSEEDGLRESLIELGRKQAKRFSWEAAARSLLECYRTCTRRLPGQQGGVQLLK
jgi:glycosyltransferase involved in cell wall biosynthesis